MVKVGDIVLYRNHRGDEFPAVVVRLHENGTVNLRVLDDELHDLGDSVYQDRPCPVMKNVPHGREPLHWRHRD